MLNPNTKAAGRVANPTIIKSAATTSAPMQAIKLTGGDIYLSGNKSGTKNPFLSVANPSSLGIPWPTSIINPSITRSANIPNDAVASRVPQSNKNFLIKWWGSEVLLKW